MGPGGSFALMTFATGTLFLMGWLYATLNNPRSNSILMKSVVLFAFPMLIWPGWILLRLPFGFWIAAACEEGLKAFASTREERRDDKFWLVTLFGIWELTVSKPFIGRLLAQPGESWHRLSMIGVVYATALPVLMHAVTAAIYAHASERRLWPAFTASWVVHAVFNITATHFAFSPAWVLIETTILATMLAALLLGLRQRSPQQNG